MTVIIASSIDPLPGRFQLIRAWLQRAANWSAVAIVLIVYLWVVSAGRWTNWPTYGTYYQDLADGFRRGQLAIATQPDPRLLALKDPYDPKTNEGLRIHDVSLYKGRFFLYWGPVPAGLLAGANVVGAPKLGDQHLAFAFAAGALLFAAGLLTHLYRRFFSETVPAWALPLAILMIGLANPGPFNLARASIYEAAILAGQMFLVGGLYFAITAFRGGTTSIIRLALAGAMLACAAGSRASLVLPVAGITLLTSIQVFRAARRREGVKTRDEVALRRIAPPSDAPDAPRIAENVGFAFVMPRAGGGWNNHARPRRLRPLAAFATPLLVGAVLLAAYNHVRFGSITELGVRYQLAGFNSLTQFHTLTSVRNVVPNVYSYLLRPPLTKSVFPYLVPRSGLDAAFPGWVPVPSFHVRDDSVAGMLLVTPFLVFAAVALVRRKGGRGLRDDVGEDAHHDASLRWVAVTLAVTVALAAVPALLLSFSTMRYLADWTMPLLLLATVGFWVGCAARAERPAPRRVWLGAGAALTAVTVLVGPLLGVTGALDQFARYNPALMKRMIEATYSGPVPGVAQVSGPVGVDEMEVRGGWWLGDERAAVDVIVPRDGWYDVELSTVFGPGMGDTSTAKLQVAADPSRPLPAKGRVIAAIVTVPSEKSSVQFHARLRAGLNRLFLSTPTQSRATGGKPDARRMIGIAKVDIRPAPSTDSRTPDPAGASAGGERD